MSSSPPTASSCPVGVPVDANPDGPAFNTTPGAPLVGVLLSDTTTTADDDAEVDAVLVDGPSLDDVVLLLLVDGAAEDEEAGAEDFTGTLDVDGATDVDGTVLVDGALEVVTGTDDEGALLVDDTADDDGATGDDDTPQPPFGAFTVTRCVSVPPPWSNHDVTDDTTTLDVVLGMPVTVNVNTRQSPTTRDVADGDCDSRPADAANATVTVEPPVAAVVADPVTRHEPSGPHATDPDGTA